MMTRRQKESFFYLSFITHHTSFRRGAPIADESTAAILACVKLYPKAMRVYGDAFADTHEHQGGMSNFWCLCASKSYGPDGEEVGLKQCSNKERSCYEEY